MSRLDEEELYGLLRKEERRTSDQFSDISDLELDQKPEIDTNSTSSEHRILGSWLKTSVTLFLLALTVGTIIHIFLSRSGTHNNSVSSPPGLRPEEDYILDTKWDFEAEPQTREYHWTIAEHDLNPDGVYRPMLLINGLFPGPLIEVNQNDEIVVHIHNKARNGTSIHWHGLFQNGTNWMDGTVGATQCPIAPGQDFTYRFNVSSQSGTYWYHSHTDMQAQDGLVGPLIIHSRIEEEIQKIPYEQDRVVLVSDHYYELSSILLEKYLSPSQENKEPVPATALLNGRNIRDCFTITNDHHCDSSTSKNALFDLPSDTNTRLRFINVGAFAEFQLEIDEHELYVSEVDGTDVMPQAIHRITISPAQRYSAILVPPNPNKGLYWLRARMITECFNPNEEERHELQPTVLGILRYWSPGETHLPSSKSWLATPETTCRDLNTSLLVPVIPLRAPSHTDDRIHLRSSFQTHSNLTRGYLNDSSQRMSPGSPILHRILDAHAANNTALATSLTTIPHGITTSLFAPDTELVYQTTAVRTLDILLQNHDSNAHPFHLHGYTFWVLGGGKMPVPLDLDEGLTEERLENPLRRDTVTVERGGWVLVRFVADNPGVWAFHCHVAWHVEGGMGMSFLVGAEVVVGWDVPGEVRGLCGKRGKMD
ncbi:multicopper oxidase-domain-containing protein [Dendryphion nanum]|uniref:Multicopper oxidase-domain-containing protein n=1 Tax=Dendryphion nanum TaxID=256645 RepID=A0A9P9DXE2_9PLEO|nr:multicopper oxidase-domain-containing protein [Dendryphion nanum]